MFPDPNRAARLLGGIPADIVYGAGKMEAR
jgi:hypothetical protein